MLKIIVLFVGGLCLCPGQLLQPDNIQSFNVSVNDTNKDMYVVHAMVYQLGIITNSTDVNDLKNSTHTGATEALTFYHSNGSGLDLTGIPQQLLPNITGKEFVAPSALEHPGALDHLTALDSPDVLPPVNPGDTKALHVLNLNFSSFM